MTLLNTDSSATFQLRNYYHPAGQSIPKQGASDESKWIIQIKEYQLFQNYPNPFSAGSNGNPSTEISYSIPEGSDVKLSVIDVLGREVTVLVNEFNEPGMYTVTFNGDNHPSGIYYYRLVVGNKILTRKMSLVK